MPIDPITGAAIIQGGGAFLSSLFGSSSPDTRGYGQFNPEQMAEINRRNRARFGQEQQDFGNVQQRSNLMTQLMRGRARGQGEAMGMGRNLFAQGTDLLRQDPLSRREANEMFALQTSGAGDFLSNLSGQFARTTGLESSQAQRGILGSLQQISQQGRFGVNQERYRRLQQNRGLAFQLQSRGAGLQGG